MGAASEQWVEILSGLERKHPVWVFPGSGGRKPIELAGTWRRIRTLAGLEDCRLHDLRHSYASSGVSGGASLSVLAVLLGHNRIQTTERYAHLSDDPIREASQRIDSKIAAALDGKPPAEVVSLRGA